MKFIKATAAVGLTAAALLLVIGAFSPTSPRGYAESTPPRDPIAQAQDRLKQTPGHWPLWAQLGHLYLEQARVTGSPSWYAKAEAALNQSLRLNQADNSSALTGLGSLANTRHDFAGAAALARQALTVSPHHTPAYGVLADALTQLGLHTEATAAVQHMLDLDPGLPALSRAAYDLEQHGQVAASTALWQRALTDAQGPQAAFIHEQLGNLAYHSGDLTSARSSYQTAITLTTPPTTSAQTLSPIATLRRTSAPSATTEDPTATSAHAMPATSAHVTSAAAAVRSAAITHPGSADVIHIPGDVIEPGFDHVLRDVDHMRIGPGGASESGASEALPLPVLDASRGVAGWHGLAKVAVALGQTDRAKQIYALLTSARPDPVLIAEYSRLLTGQERDAQLAAAQAALDLLAAAGSVDRLAAAEVAIANGDYPAAVSLCEQEWQQRKHADVADLLGWSLHLAGRDAEAIGFARHALSLGIQHREYQLHLRAIEESPK